MSELPDDPTDELPEEQISEHHKYWGGYIAYGDIQISGLPESIDINGEELSKKDEFHISIINAKGIAGLVNPEAIAKTEMEIIEEFKNFIKSNPIDEFSLLHEFCFVQKGDRKTVVVMCELPGASDFFARLSEKYKIPIPLQPFHITIFTLQPNRGIGIISDDELNKISISVEIPELENIKPA